MGLDMYFLIKPSKEEQMLSLLANRKTDPPATLRYYMGWWDLHDFICELRDPDRETQELSLYRETVTAIREFQFTRPLLPYSTISATMKDKRELCHLIELELNKGKEVAYRAIF